MSKNSSKSNRFKGFNTEVSYVTKHFIYVFLIIFCLQSESHANSQISELSEHSISVKAMNKKSFARVFFYCEQPVKFSSTIENNTLKVTFNRSFSQDKSRMTAGLSGYFSEANLSDDQKSIIFKLDDNTLKSRKFIGENFVGIDLIKPSKLSRINRKIAKKTIRTKPKKQVKLFIPTPNYHPKKTKTAAVTAPKIKLPKLTRKFEPASIDATIILPEEKPISNYTQQNKMLIYSKIRPENINDNFILLTLNEKESVKKDSLPTIDLTKNQAKLLFPWQKRVGAATFIRGKYLWILFDEYQKVNTAKITSENDIFTSGEQIYNGFYTILRFKMREKTNLISYKQDNDWIVALTDEKNTNLSEPKISTKTSDMHGSRLFLSSEDKLLPIRMIDPEVGDEMVVIPYKKAGIAFTKARHYPDYYSTITGQGVAFFLNSDSTHIELTKKGVEIFGPTNKLAGGAQSALRELQERERQRNLIAQKLLKTKGDLSLVKFNSWKIGDNKSYIANMRDLKWKITEANWRDKNKPRLDLARFYLAHRLGYDALGIIETIQKYDDEFSKTVDVKIVEAVALYVSGRYRQALVKFNEIDKQKIEDQHIDEFEFWVKAANLQVVMSSNITQFSQSDDKNSKSDNAKKEASQSNEEDLKLIYETLKKLSDKIERLDSNSANKEEVDKLKSVLSLASKYSQVEDKRFEDAENTEEIMKSVEDEKLWWAVDGYVKADATKLNFIKSSKTFLKEYPDDIYNDFALLSLDYRLKRNNISVAEEIISILRAEKRTRQANSIKFYEALFFAKDDDDDRAIEKWTELSSDILDRYNRARSILSMTSFKIKRGTIDNETAIKELNLARMIWRGGSFEFNLLQKLGELYMEEQDYMEGFRVWREIVQAFPGTNESIYIAKKMSTKFAQIFSQVSSTDLSKLDALTLYYEFRELTPIGKLGDDIVARIVDRLVEVDLLDRASAILAHQIRFRLAGEDRDNASNNLVHIHLINHKPKDAIAVLNATSHKNMIEEDIIKRKYMKSLALTELGKNNMVLALLQNDDSEQAAFLRANVYWKNGVWRKVVDEMEATFRDIRREGRQLSQVQTDQLLRLAVSYALTSRKKKLNILYEDFGPLVSNKDRKKLFSFVATDKGPVNFSDLKNTVEFDEMQSFLKQYIKADNLSANQGNS